MIEISKIRGLHDHQVLDAVTQERLDRLTEMVASRFDAPIALVSLVDTGQQSFNACIGLEKRELPLEIAFCRYAIQLGAHQVMVVKDALDDERFADDLMVTAPPYVRFYAGATLTTRNGANLGTLCVIDPKPRRKPSDEDLSYLKCLADIVVDQIELSQVRSKLEHRHQLLDLVERLSLTGYWTLNTDTRAVVWSPQVYAIHGVDHQIFNPGLDDALGFYVDEDRKMVEALITARSAAGEGWDFDATIQRRDGSRREVRSLAECLRDASGRVTGFFGVFKDLTEERSAVATAVEQERRYRLLADHARDVIAVYDAAGRFSYLSPSIRELLGYAPEDLVGRTAYDLMAPEDHQRVAKQFAMAARSPKPTTLEFRAVTKHGAVRWLEAQPRFHYDADGRTIEITDSVRDVTERHEREAALAHARTLAESATNAKAEFLANMSHEIRTPLNGVLGFAEVLANTALDNDQQRYVDRIRTAGAGLSALIDDILDFSKIESGKMTIEKRPFNLRALTTDVVDLTRVSVRGRLSLDIKFGDDVSDWVSGDEQRVRQVLLNLLGNAAKFTHEGSVSLEVHRVNDTVEMKIIDTGIGISTEALGRLFVEFAQADASVGRRFGGSGLGLSISRSLARLMGGDVALVSGINVGTTAVLKLPYRPTPKPMLTAPNRALLTRSNRAISVLAVDDIPTNLELIEILTTGAGHSVTCVSSGEAAIQLLDEGYRFDLILMDVQMPGIDGLEATRRIRAMPDVATTPIVALTANVLADQVEACRAAGMDDHLRKPIEQNALVDLFERVSRMDDNPSTALGAPSQDDPLAALKARYKQHMTTFEAEYARMSAIAPALRTEMIATFTHSIAGTSGGLGFPEVSKAAFALEAAANRCRKSGNPISELDPFIQDVLKAVARS